MNWNPDSRKCHSKPSTCSAGSNTNINSQLLRGPLSTFVCWVQEYPHFMQEIRLRLICINLQNKQVKNTRAHHVQKQLTHPHKSRRSKICTSGIHMLTPLHKCGSILCHIVVMSSSIYCHLILLPLLPGCVPLTKSLSSPASLLSLPPLLYRHTLDRHFSKNRTSPGWHCVHSGQDHRPSP